MKKRTVGINCEKQHLVIIDGIRNRVQTHDNVPIWTLFKEYINSMPDGYDFTRQRLLNSVYTVNMKSYKTTVDQYRNFLTRLGFIQLGEERGTYKKICDIPMRLTLPKIRKALKSRDWKEWFIPVHERLDINESEAPKQSWEK